MASLQGKVKLPIAKELSPKPSPTPPPPVRSKIKPEVVEEEDSSESSRSISPPRSSLPTPKPSVSKASVSKPNKHPNAPATNSSAVNNKSFKPPLLSFPVSLGKRAPLHHYDYNNKQPSLAAAFSSSQQHNTPMTRSLWTEGYPRTQVRKGHVPDEVIRDIDHVFSSFKRYRKDIYFEQSAKRCGSHCGQLPVKLTDSAKKRILQGTGAKFAPAGDADDAVSVVSSGSGVGGTDEIAFRDPSLIVFKEVFCHVDSGTVYQVNPGNKRVGVRSFKLFTCAIKHKRYLRNKKLIQQAPQNGGGFRAANHRQVFENEEDEVEDTIKIQVNKLHDISRNGWTESQPFPYVPWELASITNIVDDYAPGKLWLLEGNTYGFKAAPIQLPLYEVLRREKELDRDEPLMLPHNQLLINPMEDQQEGVIRSRSTKNQGQLKLTVRKLFDSKSRKVLLRFTSKVPTGECLISGPDGLPVSKVTHSLMTRRNLKIIQQSSEGKLSAFNFIISCTVVESGWIHVEDYVMRRNFDIVLPQKIHCVSVQPNPNAKTASKSSFLLTVSLGDYQENESQIILMTVTREKSAKLDFCYFALEAKIDFTMPLATGVDEDARKRQQEQAAASENPDFKMFSPGSSPISFTRFASSSSVTSDPDLKNFQLGKSQACALDSNYASPSIDRGVRSSMDPEGSTSALKYSAKSCSLSELSPLPILLHPLTPRTLMLICDPSHSPSATSLHRGLLILLLDTKTGGLELFQLVENNASRTAIFLTGPFKLQLLPSSPSSGVSPHPEIPSGRRVCVLYAADTNAPFEDWSIGWAVHVKQDAAGEFQAIELQPDLNMPVF